MFPTPDWLHGLARTLFPICRSITGEGVRETLGILRGELPPGFEVHEVPTGTRAFDWTVPGEWNIRGACIRDPSGKKIVDFEDSNLHVVGYSTPVNRVLSLNELQDHLYSIEEQPSAIPYVTSYYAENWGFCMTHEQRESLREGEYEVVIDSDLSDGHLTYGEWVLPGDSDEEILISTYVCHPSMANNELSGPVVATSIARWLVSAPRRYTYRIVFVPETIGAIVYLSRNLEHLKRHVMAGFVLSCIGDEGGYSCVHSRYEDTLADRVVSNVLSSEPFNYRHYSYLERQSDERQYCSPGVDLPVVTLCRSRFGMYPEYHTSLDNLDLVTPEGLAGGFNMVKSCIEALEANRRYVVNCLGEPQLGRRGLYPGVSRKGSADTVRAMKNFIAYADGSNDLIAISDRIGVGISELIPMVEDLRESGLIGDG